MNEINARIKKMIVQRLNLRIEPDQIQDAAPLFGDSEDGLRLDSIDALDLAVGLFEEFQTEVSQNDMSFFASVNTMADFVKSKLAAVV